jgi:hypothetical protein
LENGKVFGRNSADVIILVKYLAETSKTSSDLKIIYSTLVEFNIAKIFDITRIKC